jgi:hypothetical protein
MHERGSDTHSQITSGPSLWTPIQINGQHMAGQTILQSYQVTNVLKTASDLERGVSMFQTATRSHHRLVCVQRLH